jgi:hypothetical protein
MSCQDCAHKANQVMAVFGRHLGLPGNVVHLKGSRSPELGNVKLVAGPSAFVRGTAALCTCRCVCVCTTAHLPVLESALVELLAGEHADGRVHAVLHVQHVHRVPTALQCGNISIAQVLHCGGANRADHGALVVTAGFRHWCFMGSESYLPM